ncbi:MAG: ribosomal-processing cysteine protease Prp [Bacteroidales bacterium]|nr:ribosomal-processing cysteine protease Prp [Bacteroidales bacterium]
MINISVNPGVITVTGHAGYADPGQDIVCAAVSVLWQTLIESIKALTDDLIEYDFEGEQITRLVYRNPSDRTKVLIDSFFIGISGIADEYPDYVNIV